MAEAATDCSVVICNYNYDRYVGAAIDSALEQAHVTVDVVVVDDGSTDRSQQVIGAYGDSVTALFKGNGGQASAVNEGFAESRGNVVIFLDADDLLEAHAAESAVFALATGAVKVHWPLRVVDERGRPTGTTFPDVPLPAGDLRPEIVDQGPGVMHYAPTSGNAFAREYLESVLPMPVAAYRHSADKYLSWLAAASGPIVRIDEPLSRYRRHPVNYSRAGSTDEAITRYAARSRDAFPMVAERLGLPVSVIPRWESHDWWCRLDRARLLIERNVPSGASLALLDNWTWAARGTVGGREVKQLAASGAPDDAAALIADAEKLRREGAAYLVVADVARWWLDYYEDFANWLDQVTERVVADPVLDIRKHLS